MADTALSEVADVEIDKLLAQAEWVELRSQRHRSRRKWSTSDERRLAGWVGQLQPSEMAQRLGRSLSVVVQKLGAMGFDLRSAGFHIVLSKSVPELVRSVIAGVVGKFLSQYGLTRQDLRYFLVHPGGQKLLAYIESELALTREDTALSWQVLREYGNLSSATVLFIAKEFLRQPARPGERGLLAAFGPGFSVELALLEWI